MLIDINKIQVKDRIRKDFGNIEELAQDIKENGLINPPVVTPEYELIAGERRLRACKSLGYQQIEVRPACNRLHQQMNENWLTAWYTSGITVKKVGYSWCVRARKLD